MVGGVIVPCSCLSRKSGGREEGTKMTHENQTDGSVALKCNGPIGDRWDDDSVCSRPVTHIDEKGFIYCRECGDKRKAARRCRKLTATELNLLRAGEVLSAY